MRPSPELSVVDLDTARLPGHRVRLAVERPLRLDCGAELSPIAVAYQTYGELNQARSNAILVCHALTGDQFAAEPHPITGPVLIGRRPLAPRIPDPAAPAPELVAVPSPQSVVSGTHLELRLQGTRLIATDLRSTNGTIVRTATGTRRMRAGESIVVAPGTRLDLGDGTIIEILTPLAPHE